MEKTDEMQFKTEIDNLRRLIELRRQRSTNKVQVNEEDLIGDKEDKCAQTCIVNKKCLHTINNSEIPKTTYNKLSKKTKNTKPEKETGGEESEQFRGEDMNKEEKTFVKKEETLHTRKKLSKKKMIKPRKKVEKETAAANIGKESEQLNAIKTDMNATDQTFITKEGTLHTGEQLSKKKKKKKEKKKISRCKKFENETAAGSFKEISEQLSDKDTDTNATEQTFVTKEETLHTVKEPAKREKMQCRKKFENEEVDVHVSEGSEQLSGRDIEQSKAAQSFIAEDEVLCTGKEPPKEKKKIKRLKNLENYTVAKNLGEEREHLSGDDTAINKADKTFVTKDEIASTGERKLNRKKKKRPKKFEKEIAAVNAQSLVAEDEGLRTGKEPPKKKKKKKCLHNSENETVAENLGEGREHLRGDDTTINKAEQTFVKKDEIALTGKQKLKRKKKKRPKNVETETAAAYLVEGSENLHDEDTGINKEETAFVTRDETLRTGKQQPKRKKIKRRKKFEKETAAANLGEGSEHFSGEAIEEETTAEQKYAMKEERIPTGNEFLSKKKAKSCKKFEEEKSFAKTRTGEYSDDINCHSENTYDEMRDIETVNAGNGEFKFQLNETEWDVIKPDIKEYIGIRKRSVRRLQNNWTDIFAENATVSHPGCVIAFKSHHCKTPRSRRLSGAYVTATAFCKGHNCSGKFVFTIENEIMCEGKIDVHYSVTGHIVHDLDEVNRRNLSGLKRNQIGRKCRSTTSTMTYYDQLLQGNPEQMSQGNYTTVPNHTVLRKIVSEIVQKENLHQNIIAELQMLKDCYEKENDPYIRDIGIDPFTLILFSETQLQTIKTLSALRKLNIYIDATGSIISKIAGQKQPYLYSLVVKPESNLPGVSVADMITTQHSIPRIELFLNTVKRSAGLTGANIKIQKVETDYSFALIQACLKSFNNLNIKSYLIKCFEVMNSSEMDENLTVHHLCSAHILQDFIRQLKTIKSPMKKTVRELLLKSFALLQNASSLQEAVNLYTDICHIFLSENVNSRVKCSLASLNKKFKTQGIKEEEEDYELNGKEELTAEDEKVHRQTIRAASPFTKIFEEITRKAESEHSSLPRNGTNEFHFPEAVHCLLEKFMHILPLWTGIILSKLVHNEQEMTRDTNSPVENWFKVIKNDIGLKSRSRPSKLVINLRQLVNGRLLESHFPNARKTKTSRKRKIDQVDIDSMEEIWSKRSTKKKSRYMPKTKTIQQTTKGRQMPNVMSWGGNHEGFHLDNTCTIDNGLTILHLFYIQNPTFAEYLHERKENIWRTLLTVFELMNDCQFTEAKLVWVNYTRKNIRLTTVTNLYGDEADMFFSYIDNEWISSTESTCIQSCPEPFKETRETHCITTSASEAFSNLQELIDNWMVDTAPCNTCCEDDESRLCTGTRQIRRKILHFSPVLIFRLYEHCLHDRITTNQVIESKEIQLGNRSYVLAGITLHRNLHYCAMVFYMGNIYWYDGLRGRLDDVPGDREDWFPCHAVFCQQ